MSEPPPPRSDDAMIARVLAALGAPDIGLDQVHVEYIEDTLVLRGRAPSAEARDRAGALAQEVSGAAGVENRIRTG